MNSQLGFNFDNPEVIETVEERKRKEKEEKEALKKAEQEKKAEEEKLNTARKNLKASINVLINFIDKPQTSKEEELPEDSEIDDEMNGGEDDEE